MDPRQFSQEQANALRASRSKSRRCAAGKSSVFEQFRARLHIQPPDQTAADTHRKVEGRCCDKGDCCPPRRLDTACWQAVWKTEDRRGCSGHVLASKISHVQYTYEVAVVLTLQSMAGPCKSGFQRRTAEDLPAECRNWRLFFDGIYYCWDRDMVLRLVVV